MGQGIPKSVTLQCNAPRRSCKTSGEVSCQGGRVDRVDFSDRNERRGGLTPRRSVPLGREGRSRRRVVDFLDRPACVERVAVVAPGLVRLRFKQVEDEPGQLIVVNEGDNGLAT